MVAVEVEEEVGRAEDPAVAEYASSSVPWELE